MVLPPLFTAFFHPASVGTPASGPASSPVWKPITPLLHHSISDAFCQRSTPPPVHGKRSNRTVQPPRSNDQQLQLIIHVQHVKSVAMVSSSVTFSSSSPASFPS